MVRQRKVLLNPSSPSKVFGLVFTGSSAKIDNTKTTTEQYDKYDKTFVYLGVSGYLCRHFENNRQQKIRQQNGKKSIIHPS